MKITYFVHGTTIDNETGLATGWAGGQLSEKGVKQARDLGDLVADQHFDVIFCSDLKRAVDSAELGFGDKYKIIPDARLRECDYGDFNQKPEEFKHDMTQFIDTPFLNGESYRDVEKRLSDFLNFLRENHASQRIAIVAHQAPQLALDVLLKNKTWPQAIAEDWRNKKAWQPGWGYILNG